MADEENTLDCTDVLMEQILEKLKLLNYEREFLGQTGLKQLNRAYFAVQLNANEQFNYFTTLVKWLFELCGSNFDFNKYDDPVTVAQNIQFEMKKMGLESSFPPIKLKAGSGEQVCNVVDNLLDKALKVKKFIFKKHRLEKETQGGGDDDAVDDQGENEPDNMAENISVASEEDPDEALGNEFAGYNQEIDEERQVIQSQISAKEWILECERVATKLKFNVKSDAKEWRSHIEQTRQYSENIKKILPESRDQLERVSDQLGKTLEKISKRENNINVNLGELGGEYKTKSESLKSITTRYQNLNTGVKEMGEQYRVLTEKLEIINNKADERGNTATDSTPIVKIKSSLQKLNGEIKSMDVRTGVVSHTILQQKVKAKRHKNENGEDQEENNLDDLADVI